jgi:isopenicillin N synthase-like dioxygenase
VRTHVDAALSMASCIPVIDLTSALAGGDRRRAGELIDRAAAETGFFSITGHGVPDAVILDLNCAAHAFFALPLAEKLKAMPADATIPRGTSRSGTRRSGVATPTSRRRISRSIFHFGRESWPDAPLALRRPARATIGRWSA